ncbi:MAG: SGNH/GDSL hydrolase family protein [Clostridium sp.]|uniref:SGNH/GDSL hydrolase family protein n=1 Tax=Clostridium sp. TaxID=1506 RepID=UPI003032552E
MKNKGMQITTCIVLLFSLIGVLGMGIYKSNRDQDELVKLKNDYEIYINTVVKPLESEDKSDNNTGEKDDIKDKFELKDKKILSLGDGVSKSGIYQGKVKELTDMASVTNLANNGLLLKEMVNNISVETLKDIDLVMIMGGTNDFTNNKIIGTKADDDKKDSFYGNIQSVINKLKSLKPEIEIVFLTPLKHGKVPNQPSYPEANNVGSKLDDYAKAIEEVCEKNSVKVIDLFNESGIESSNIAQYTTNNIMLNESGNLKVAESISDKLKELYNGN